MAICTEKQGSENLRLNRDDQETIRIHNVQMAKADEFRYLRGKWYRGMERLLKRLGSVWTG